MSAGRSRSSPGPCPTKIIELGEFEVGDNATFGLDSYLDGLIEGATEAPLYPSRINPAAQERLKGKDKQ